VSISEGHLIFGFGFGGRSAHLAYRVHKIGRKTPIIIIIIILIFELAALPYIDIIPNRSLSIFRYNENLKEAKLLGIRKGLLNGVSMGLIFLIMFSSYGLAFWYGSKLVFDGEITPGTIMTVRR